MNLRLWALALIMLTALLSGHANAQSIAPVILPGGCGTGAFVSGTGYLTLDPTGELCNSGGNTNIPTFSVSKTFSNSSAGDLFCVYGSSAGKVVRIKGVRVTGISASGASAEITIVRRSSLDTGGGLTAITPTTSDSTNPSSTASAMYFTSAPTAGTLVGAIRDRYINLPTVSGGSISEGLFQFTPYYDQPQVLRSSTEGLCVSATSTSGGSWAVDAEYNEQ